MRALPLVAAAGLALLASACASPPEPRVLQFSAVLDGTREVPPTSSAGVGRASISFDRPTHRLDWRIDYQGLSGPLQAAHFHGPADPGENGPVEVPIAVAFSPLGGSAILTPDQTEDLLSGLLYVNLHTPLYPNGEIRGQVVEGALPPPTAQAYPPPSYPTQPYPPATGYPPPSSYPPPTSYPPPSSYPPAESYPPGSTYQPSTYPPSSYPQPSYPPAPRPGY